MELVASGLEMLPEKLTPRAIYQLSYFEVSKIQEQLFSVQVVSIKHAGLASEEAAEENLMNDGGSASNTQSSLQKRMSFQMQSQGLQLEVSDGIGTAKMLINREVIAELNLY